MLRTEADRESADDAEAQDERSEGEKKCPAFMPVSIEADQKFADDKDEGGIRHCCQADAAGFEVVYEAFEKFDDDEKRENFDDGFVICRPQVIALQKSLDAKKCPDESDVQKQDDIGDDDVEDEGKGLVEHIVSLWEFHVRDYPSYTV